MTGTIRRLEPGPVDQDAPQADFRIDSYFGILGSS